MDLGVQRRLLPRNQRRTLEELTADLDLRSGDSHAKQTAFWTMLMISSVIASAGVLSDSTATVIGAMIIAPLSTPIMGIALALAKRERNGSLVFVLAGCLAVITVGAVASRLIPGGADLLANGQIAGRTSPGALDMLAALATGLAGSVALARKDVAAVLPGVAIAISLVPPLAVVGLCLGRGEFSLAIGAALLFVSNLLALVLAGTLVFTALGYASEASIERTGSRRGAYTFLSVMLTLVFVPLLANTFVTYVLDSSAARVEQAGQTWLSDTPGATVIGVENRGLQIVLRVQAPEAVPPTSELLAMLGDDVPDVFGIEVEVTQGRLDVIRQSSTETG